MEKGVAIIADPNGRGYSFAKGIYNNISERPGRDFDIKLIDMEVKKFKDGEFKVRIKDNIRGRRCCFIHDSNNNPADWYVQLEFAIQAMRFSSKNEVNVIIPYTRFARQDRKDESRVSVNMKALAKMISQYADRIMTVDLHNSTTSSFFEIPCDELSSAPSVVDYIVKNHKEILNNLIIVSPDAGGAKRAVDFSERFERYGFKPEVAIGYKTRKEAGKVEEVRIIGEVEDKNCLIVDDIIDSGGTLLMTLEELKRRGAKNVSAYGTHGIFSKGTKALSGFDKIFVSDTLNVEKNGDLNIEIISLVSLFGEAIYRDITGQSLSVLFDSKDKDKNYFLGTAS
ncbi:ribose-phosphate diphosphokinase [Candidatus Pacearchaeota archaeon]|nr:ribose-phosphate diphosphokinase [Candidatus Pacearchaeota archaeon]